MAPVLSAQSRLRPSRRPPNFLVILTDDLGFGDVGFTGSKIKTPNLDKLAAAGAQFNQFYAGNPVCSPSRAAFLTGRYPTRMGIPGVIFPTDSHGLPDTETTIAQMLKPLGYTSACIGKWHLGSRPEFLPTNRGFDMFYGVPYSNDMRPLPLMHNLDVWEPDTDNDFLTQKYTAAAVDYIRANKDQPFFLYLAHNVPHQPLGASPAFRGKSELGIYADVVQEMDWSVGQVVQALHDSGIANDTLSVFTSDNGPWFLGSSGRLRGRKAETYEGGVREPFVAYMPDTIPAGTAPSGFGSLMDLFPTFANLAGAPWPTLPLDGINIWPMLTGEQDALARDVLLYFDSFNLQCARVGPWKLHVARYNSLPWAEQPAEGRVNLPLAKPELYNLESDAEESYECSDAHPDVVKDIQDRIQSALPSFPAQVQTEWALTRARQTQPASVGAMPAPK
ncbi:MAG: sulfatase [Bryobacterales bacterium]|nr:sulfatase [Bryobacterales bacterium]